MFDFDAIYDNEPSDVTSLAADPLQTLDGEVGHISHLLVGPTTHRAEWAVVVDEDSGHHLIPVRLIDREDDTLLVRLLQDAVESSLSIGDPEELGAHRLTQAVIDALDNLTQHAADAGTSPGDDVLGDIDTSLLAGAGVYQVHSLRDLAHTIERAPDLPVASEGESPSRTPPPAAFPPFPAVLEDRAGIDDRATSPTPAGDAGQAGEAVRDEAAERIGRNMVAELPKAVHVGKRFSIQVQINEEAGASGVLTWLPGVTGGSTVTVNATVPESFDVHGELTHDVTVPESGDSHPVLFSFTPRVIGTFPVRISAFVGGSYLGQLNTEVSVGNEAGGTSLEASSTLSGASARDGEVSLQITYDDASRTFRFLFVAGGDWRPVPSKPIQGDLQARLESVIAELDSYARADSGLSEADAQQRIRSRGFELWRDLVPDEIKAAVFDHLDDISQLTIISDREIVPWELLYPQSPAGDEPGFLVSLFPVNRWVMAKPWTDRLSLDRPAFVLPDNSPPLASDEVRAIGQALGTPDAPTVRNRQQLLASLRQPEFDLLHFACHNSFASDAGSHITFPDSSFTPSDLSLLAASQPLRDKSCLVFINACRTQGTTPVYTTFENWAKSFLDLGAAAVVGTSWAVRDRSARPFAEAVYERLDAGDTLGQSVASARTRVSTSLGDPTWLAYTVYGDPNAKVSSP